MTTGIDVRLLTRWCDDNGIDVTPPVTATLIAGGRSNLTYRLHDSRGRDYVLRRPPLGSVLPSAHDMAREARIIGALEATGVPVPRNHGYCADPSVIGAPFYVMNFVAGRVVATDDEGTTLPRAARVTASEQMIDVLASIHLLDVDEIGLGRLSRGREDYVCRQLRRWHRQFHSSTDRHLPLVDEVHRALSAGVPPQRYTGLVHGDYRPGNVLLAADGSVEAVLDWELATLGDTMADLGWLLATWREDGEPEVYQSPTGHAGFLTRAELIRRYQQTTGRDVSDMPFYIAFSLWRLACIYEGIYARYRSGVMGDESVDVEEQGRIVVRLAEAAGQILGLDGGLDDGLDGSRTSEPAREGHHER
jgi:aminoglycoside phosphotransferase (APT) family kinase protein